MKISKMLISTDRQMYGLMADCNRQMTLPHLCCSEKNANCAVLFVLFFKKRNLLLAHFLLPVQTVYEKF